MKKITLKIFLIAFSAIIASSCGKDEYKPVDEPFVHIMKDELSAVTVNSSANYIATYNVYLSSASLTENLEVTYEILKGSGLVEGEDYQMITTGNKLVFLPRIFDMPIRIKWLPKPVDPTKDNTLKIRITGNSKNFTIGLPGTNQQQGLFVITKVN